MAYISKYTSRVQQKQLTILEEHYTGENALKIPVQTFKLQSIKT